MEEPKSCDTDANRVVANGDPQVTPNRSDCRSARFDRVDQSREGTPTPHTVSHRPRNGAPRIYGETHAARRHGCRIVDSITYKQYVRAVSLLSLYKGELPLGRKPADLFGNRDQAGSSRHFSRNH